MLDERFMIHTKDRGKYDNGVYIKDNLKGVNHQMLDYGSAQDVLNLINELYLENQKLKMENKQLNHDLDLYEENNVNEILNDFRVELVSRVNDCIEEFKI